MNIREIDIDLLDTIIKEKNHLEVSLLRLGFQIKRFEKSEDYLEHSEYSKKMVPKVKMIKNQIETIIEECHLFENESEWYLLLENFPSIESYKDYLELIKKYKQIIQNTTLS